MWALICKLALKKDTIYILKEGKSKRISIAKESRKMAPPSRTSSAIRKRQQRYRESRRDNINSERKGTKEAGLGAFLHPLKRAICSERTRKYSETD